MRCCGEVSSPLTCQTDNSVPIKKLFVVSKLRGAGRRGQPPYRCSGPCRLRRDDGAFLALAPVSLWPHPYLVLHPYKHVVLRRCFPLSGKYRCPCVTVKPLCFQAEKLGGCFVLEAWALGPLWDCSPLGGSEGRPCGSKASAVGSPFL